MAPSSHRLQPFNFNKSSIDACKRPAPPPATFVYKSVNKMPFGNNTIIVTGRNAVKLKELKNHLPTVHTY